MISKQRLETLYLLYNKRRWVHPDPLEFVYYYREGRDREIVAFVASSLAYGRVGQILKSVASVLQTMNGSPYKYLLKTKPSYLQADFEGFKHRFTTGEEVASMLEGIGRVLHRYGSLEACFLAGEGDRDEDVLPALSHLVREISSDETVCNSLLPFPEKGSACKRLNLFLRWMVRRDRVDPGVWTSVSPSRLIVPLDTHMHSLARSLGLTKRKNGDLRTALEVTRAFRQLVPEDPVRYDFALTRLGIRRDPQWEKVLKRLVSDHVD